MCWWRILECYAFIIANIKEKSDIAPDSPTVICLQTDDSNSANIFRVLQLRTVLPTRRSVTTADDEALF
jgi:hypothetical protein